MSKKIIYLLSLLMALSLVFASCKKNGLDPTNISGDGGKEDTIYTPTDPETGFISQEEMADHTDKYIEDKAVLAGNNEEFSRNPVLAVLGEKRDNVLIISERRYKSPGSGNDIGLDGVNKTDLIYVTSGNSGANMSQIQIIGTPASDAQTSHAAPVVFTLGANNDTVVVVASTGAGISRTSQAYESREVQSGLDYIVGTLDANTGGITWGTWKPVQVNGQNIKEFINADSDFNSVDSNMKQFGTHSARGYVGNDNNTMYLPVIVANQGTQPGTFAEVMGAIIFKSTDQGATWSKLTSGATIQFSKNTQGNASEYKEVRIIGGTENALEYLAVPSPTYNGNANTRYFGYGTADNTTVNKATITAGEGSAGYLKITGGWYGDQVYDPKAYNPAGGSDMTLLSHVANTEKNLKLYLYSDGSLQSTPTRSINIVTDAKSSSIDILGDGTIVTAAEEGLRAGSKNKNDFVIRYSRYTQQYLSKVTQKQ